MNGPADNTRQSWSISDLAREFGITPRAIRHYEQEGLLSPERRGQVRIYGPAERVKLILILRGNRLGFTLAESREMIGLYDPASGNITQLQRMLEKLAAKRAELQRRLEDILQLQTELEDVEKRCRDELADAQQLAAATRKSPVNRKPSPRTAP